MARCTAPVRDHRIASGAANCPACGGRYGGYRGYSGYTTQPRWSRAGSSVMYTPAEVRTLTPIREIVQGEHNNLLQRSSVPLAAEHCR